MNTTPNIKTIRCPSCAEPVEYDTRDYLNIHCGACGNMFRPPTPRKIKKGHNRRKRGLHDALLIFTRKEKEVT